MSIVVNDKVILGSGGWLSLPIDKLLKDVDFNKWVFDNSDIVKVTAPGKGGNHTSNDNI